MIKRNDLCWCGSGKKYKRCHLQSDTQKGKEKVVKMTGPMIKTAEEIAAMRRAGAFNGELMDYLRPFIKPGVSSEKIDSLAYEYTIKHGHTPACLGYHGYPKSVCVSKNEVVCHGIPSSEIVLEEGDIVNVDLTTIVDGFHGDSSETFFIGEVAPQTRTLVEVTAHALLKGIEAVKPGANMMAIGKAIEPYVKKNGFSVVQQYTGHGIGRNFHEFFSVYHHVTRDAEDVTMQPGMTFTIEPMVNMGNFRVVTDPQDGWTVRTKDLKLSAQFEHTVLVTDSGVEILTLTPSQRQAGKPLIVDSLTL
ncbi:MAG: type I methionyl aminopeptidase [Chitinivibrionales bacterium]